MPTSPPVLFFLAVPIIAVAFLVTAGCAGAPTQEEISKADYGTPISQEDAQRQAGSFLKRILKDPDSARVDFASVAPGWFREAPIHGGGLKFGYMLNAKVNGKNSYGAYMGYKPYRFMFFNGTITSVYAEQNLGTYGDTYMGKLY
jgi:hypothetical protein